MTDKPMVIGGGETVTVRVPISIKKRGGRKVILAPEGNCNGGTLVCRSAGGAVIKAVARAFRWRRLLETGKYGALVDLAAAERINFSYMCRVLRLTLLSPLIVESIVDGKQRPSLSLQEVLKPLPPLWSEQESAVLPGGARPVETDSRTGVNEGPRAPLPKHRTVNGQ